MSKLMIHRRRMKAKPAPWWVTTMVASSSLDRHKRGWWRMGNLEWEIQFTWAYSASPSLEQASSGFCIGHLWFSKLSMERLARWSSQVTAQNKCLHWEKSPAELLSRSSYSVLISKKCGVCAMQPSSQDWWTLQRAMSWNFLMDTRRAVPGIDVIDALLKCRVQSCSNHGVSCCTAYQLHISCISSISSHCRTMSPASICTGQRKQ